ncbi:MAG: hypothetical protein GC155_06225 [Alphaproteobacteria bacterium]|nr:hypothetical protein [Alphaproteobacteria bacterium]
MASLPKQGDNKDKSGTGGGSDDKKAADDKGAEDKGAEDDIKDDKSGDVDKSGGSDDDAGGGGAGDDGDDKGGADDGAVVPETADGYKVELPDIGIKGADGEPLKLDPEDPAVGQLRDWAHKHQLPQAAVDGALEMYGGIIKQSIELQKKAGDDRHEAQLKELGSGDSKKGSEYAVRVLKAALGAFPENDRTHEQGLLDALRTPAAVKAIEALLNGLNAEGSGRDPNKGKERDTSDGARARRLFGKSMKGA